MFLHQKEHAKAHKDVDAVIANKKRREIAAGGTASEGQDPSGRAPGCRAEGPYFIEKAYDSSSKIMDELSSKHWVEVIPATLARDCCGVAFSYWEELLDSDCRDLPANPAVHGNHIAG